MYVNWSHVSLQVRLGDSRHFHGEELPLLRGRQQLCQEHPVRGSFQEIPGLSGENSSGPHPRSATAFFVANETIYNC